MAIESFYWKKTALSVFCYYSTFCQRSYWLSLRGKRWNMKYKFPAIPTNDLKLFNSGNELSGVVQYLSTPHEETKKDPYVVSMF